MPTVTMPVRSMMFHLVLACLALLLAAESRAAVYTVTELADFNFPGPDPTILNLRLALTTANQHPGTDLINIPDGTYNLTIAGADEDENFAGDLDVTDNVFIVGEGPDKTIIDGRNINRVLHVVSEGVSVAIVNLTIQNGMVTNTHNQPHGAGIFNKGNLSLYNVVVNNNTNSADNNFGGGVYNDGVLTITNATFSGNQALRGGALFTNNPSQTTIERSLLVNNQAYTRGSAIESFGDLQVKNTTVDGNASPYGSAIDLPTGTVDISFCTITNNTSGNSLGVLEWGSTSLTLRHTILAENQSANSDSRNCSYKIPTATYNLEDADTCGFSTATNLINTDPRLGPLQDNGGPTLTRALLDGSPAIDYVKVDTGVTVDQRDFKRPVGSWADIGAYEYIPPQPICFPIQSPEGKTGLICL